MVQTVISDKRIGGRIICTITAHAVLDMIVADRCPVSVTITVRSAESGSNAKGEDRSIAEAMPEHEPAIHEPMPEREPVSKAVPKHESMSAHHGHLLNIGSGRAVKKGKRAA